MIARSSSACWSRLPRHCAAKPACSSFFSAAAGGGARFQKRTVRRTKLLLGEMDQRPIVTERADARFQLLQHLDARLVIPGEDPQLQPSQLTRARPLTIIAMRVQHLLS